MADLTEPRDLFGIALTTGDFDSPGVAEQAEDGDRFGGALASGDLNADGPADLAGGAPGQNLNVGFGSGVAHVLPGSNGGLTATGSQLWSQDSPGVAGAPEFLDFFGQTMAASDPSAAEASPGARAATPAASSRPTPPARR